MPMTGWSSSSMIQNVLPLSRKFDIDIYELLCFVVDVQREITRKLKLPVHAQNRALVAVLQNNVHRKSTTAIVELHYLHRCENAVHTLSPMI